jgi:hypothetical protein
MRVSIRTCFSYNSIRLGLFSGLLFLQASPVAEAVSPQTTSADILRYMVSDEGVRRLPQYCQCKLAEATFRQRFTSHGKEEWPAEFDILRKKYIPIIGIENWLYFHHYCSGMMRLNEALEMPIGSTEQERREATLVWALREFEFMEDRANERSFPLWAQLFMYKFRIYMLLNQPANAQKALLKAVELQKKRKSP